MIEGSELGIMGELAAWVMDREKALTFLTCQNKKP